MAEDWICTKCYKVIQSVKIFECCGSVELFDPAKHGNHLISKSNAWIAVYERWKNHPVFKQIADEYQKDGCYSAAAILNEFISRAIERSEIE